MLVALLATGLSAGAQDPAPVGLDVYVGTLPADQVGEIVDLGVDRQELEVAPAPSARGDKARVRVEAILSRKQVAALGRDGIELAPKRIDGQTVAQRATLQAANGFNVFRQYSGSGGLKEEFEQAARDNRKITKLVTYGESINGEEIVALKVSKNAAKDRDGKKPAVLYLGAQHAREWITPEMIRRLMHYVLDGYEDGDKTIRRLVDKNELWFVPVANPDGYDFTFEPGQRLWRKNLRDNNGDGVIAPGDGVDPNRNFATKWGYDNEGSSPDPSSETFRGSGPNSEPETQALDAFMERVGFEFFVNYHSAAELLLYGTGWQVNTPTPDDVIYEAMAGDDANPAVPGYDPDISAELYTTNGDTDTHMTERYGTLGFTPEMSTCEAASNSVPDDEWVAANCGSGFHFPDDEGLVQAEFEKNIPFAMSVAKSADDPDDPESVVGRDTEDFRVDTFEVSYGDPQTVAVVAKRALDDVRLNYRIDGGRTRTARVSEWEGGERYGDENDDYYAEYRGQVRGADPGDDVTVWFTAEEDGRGDDDDDDDDDDRRGRDDDDDRRGGDDDDDDGRGDDDDDDDDRDVQSERFTYSLESDSGADVLVLANEDYTGVNPDYPASVTAPKYDEAHVAAIETAGYDADVWDMDAQGVPHDLGVLGHYDAVVWYLGDNRLTQDEEDEFIQTPFGELPDIGVAERQQYLTLAVRDYVNDGGKLIHAGETAQYSGLPGIGDAVGGLFHASNGDETSECVVHTIPGFFEDCLFLADDFRQYYLGAFTRTDAPEPAGVSGIAEPIEGYQGSFGGPVAEGDNPLNEAGSFQPTSEVLPPAQFPQFTSQAAAEYGASGDSPFAPVEGEQYAGALHADSSYMRLTKTVNLSTASSAELQFQLSINTEPSYDNVIVEARTAGGSDWTTLPELGGRSNETPPAECTGNGFLLQLHPFLRNYLDGADCQTGVWHRMTSGPQFPSGWHEVAFDLSAFAGKQVEVSITYVTDPASGGVGAFVDDTRIVIDDAVAEADGFEGPTSTWTPGGPPAGSPPNASNWQIGGQLVNFFAGTSTQDSLLLGFGLEQLATDAERADLVERALDGLLSTE
jgi:Zinc carboxypeptidase/Immune inhibitor A peptidase M6